MTVKLAKFFSSSSNGEDGGTSNIPPPLPPPNPPSSYYHHQQHYNPCTYDDNDDDSMSLCSNRMTSRDHPFNNSQRPLLERNNPPQLLLNKKKLNQLHQEPPQQHRKSYISPYVQQQKRDSAKGLHGFNDFNILSQQYNKHLRSPHTGYPYGSPPSPTAASSDFVFDQLSIINNNSAILANKPLYGNVDDTNCKSNKTIPTTTTTHMGKSSRFEDDFCCRRNVEFSTGTQSGPFIFGIPPEQQADHRQQKKLHCIPAGGRGFSDSTDEEKENNYDAVIYSDNKKALHKIYNTQATLQSTSDTSSSSPDDSRKGATKFLLRKRKSKKNTVKNDKETRNYEGNFKEKPLHRKPTIKCVVVGDGAVGKTNLILSYLENRFTVEHIPTASDIYNADVMVNESPVNLTLCDTAGQDTLDSLRELCYPDSDVFLLCFSVAKPETFHAIKTKWAPKFSTTKASLILVGTQSDLRNDAMVLNKLLLNGENPIQYSEAWDFAANIGAKYIETSSKTKDKVKEVFDTAIWEGLVPLNLPPTPSFWRKLFCLA